MKNKHTMKRREFIKRTAAAVVSAPYIVPSSVFGQNAPSNRLTMGFIGIGGMGSGDLREVLRENDIRVIAVCDVDEAHRVRAKETIERTYARNQASGTYTGCDMYNDFRELIDREDIDTVSIATPEHWHGIPAIAASNAGKDIHCQKPVGLTIEEGRAMCETIKRNGTVWATGTQQRSEENFRFGCELVRNGRIGELKEIFVYLPSWESSEQAQFAESKGFDGYKAQAPMPVPDGFDYDMWLGPAPWSPYHEKRCHFNYRFNLDYAGGRLTDWGAHHFDIAHWAMDLDLSGPIEIEGTGDFPRDGLWNAAKTWDIELKYANGITVHSHSVLGNQTGVKFVGTEGTVFVCRGYYSRSLIETEPKSLVTSIIGRDEIHLYRSNNKFRNFIDCVRSRKETAAPIEIGHRSSSVATLANIAMLLGRKLQWNPEQERFENDPEADRMLSRAMRSPWRL